MIRESKKKDTKDTISLIVSFVGLFFTIIAWLFPIKEPSNVIESFFQKINENRYFFLFLFALGIILSLFLLLLNKRKKAKGEEQEATITDEERETLIKSLGIRYNERFKQKLDNRFPINLEFQYTLQGIRERRNLFFEDDKNIKNEKTVRKELIDLLKQHSFLLILGEPGIGKTSQLLNLGIGLLNECKENDKQPIPIIFNLATYTNKYEQFEDWLQSNLVNMYNFPPKAVANILKNNKIIPLLDGFDEIGNYLENEEEKKELRAKCFNSIQKYKMELNPHQFVICSRIAEYEQTENSAPVTAQIKIKKPTVEQIKNLLKKAIKESSENSDIEVAKNLLIHLDKTHALGDVLCIPFYYNALLQMLYEPQDESIDFPDDTDKLKEFIVNLYIERKLNNNKHTKYTAEKTRKYLGWLSIWLKNQSGVNFELADFQPNCLRKKWLYTFFSMSFCTIIFFILFNVISGHGIASKYDINRLTATILTAIVSLIIGSFCGIGNNEITTRDMLKFNYRNLLHLKSWISFMFGIIIFVPSFAFVLFLLFDEFPFLYFFTITVLIVLFSSTYVFFDTSHFVNINKPYSRLGNMKYDLIQNGGIIFATLFFPFVFYYYTATIFDYFVIVCYCCLLIVLCSLLLSPLFSFFMLNYLLRREKSMAFPMVPFFTYCTKLRILETDGGSWRFRHQILQDYFCNQKK